jgi:hypothetical protein
VEWNEVEDLDGYCCWISSRRYGSSCECLVTLIIITPKSGGNIIQEFPELFEE